MTQDLVWQVRDMVGWTAAPQLVSWEAFTEVTGIAFPADFRTLVEAFPPGVFQETFKILHPASYADPGEFRTALTEHAKLLRKKRGEAPDVYPAPGGLIPWGTVEFDYMLCWLPDGDDPDKWPVAVASTSIDEREERCTLTAAGLVRALLTVPSPISVLDDIAESVQPPVFYPFEHEPVTALKEHRNGNWR